MSEPTIDYLIPAGLEEESLIEHLKAPDAIGAVVDDLPAVTIKHTLLDTFDWRLYRAGRMLYYVPDGDEARLLWAKIPSGRALISMPTTGSAPRWGEDLPPGPIKKAVAPIIDIRALRSVVRLDGHYRPLLLCDQRGEFAVRVTLDNMSAQIPEGPRQAVPRGLRLEIFPNGERVAEAAMKALGELAVPVGDPAWRRALSAVGVIPAAWSGRPDVALDPEDRADDAVKQVLLQLLAAIEENAVGVLEGVDVECLHDLRVAVRRSRSALSRLKGVLPEKTATWARAELAWLQDLTGPARDLDVFAGQLSDLTAGLPAALAGGVGPLANLIDEHRVAANAVVCTGLRSERFKGLVVRWRRALITKSSKRPKAPEALTPVGELASDRIWRSYRQILKDGRAITADSPVDDLHDLRKALKKLRYLMEFFRRLYPDQDIAASIKILKRLQNALGRLNDAQVQHDFMLALGPALKRDAAVPPASLMAAGVMVERAGLALERQRLAFHDRYAVFDTAENRAVFKALFKR